MTDSGAAAERTRLAWRRTGLSVTVVALLAVRPAVTDGDGATLILLAAATMVVWAMTIALIYRRTTGLRTRPPRPGRSSVIGCAVLTLTLAIIGGLVVTF
ncbi:MAG TPA: DUF202 domain-containing protein [Actinoplanes sp.]|nr:DUF202 domain-containing protein [Actinoplanes sp.]